MTRAFVADASIAIGWVHPAQAMPETAAMLDAIAEGAILEVPTLWPLEVANALTVLVRRRKLSEQERQTAFRWLRALRYPSITRYRRWPQRTICPAMTRCTWSLPNAGTSCWAATTDRFARRRRAVLAMLRRD